MTHTITLTAATERKHPARRAAYRCFRNHGTWRWPVLDAALPCIFVLLSCLSVRFGQGIAEGSLFAVDFYDLRVEPTSGFKVEKRASFPYSFNGIYAD